MIKQKVIIKNEVFLESPAAGCINIGSEEPGKIHITKIELRNTGYLIKPGQMFVLPIEIELDSNHEKVFIPNSDLIKTGIGSSMIYIDSNQKEFHAVFYNINQQHSIRLTPNTEVGVITKAFD